MRRLIRQCFYLLLVLVALTACGGRTAPANEAAAPGPAAETSPYQVLVSSADLTPDGSRLVLLLRDGETWLAGAQGLEVALFAIDEAGAASEQVWEGTATPYQMGTLQYWVSYPDLPAAGKYGVQAVITTQEGNEIENRAVVTVKEKADAPAVGDPAPRSDTLTLADVTSVEDLTSAGPYIEDFYRLSVAEAADSGKVSIIAFATPGHCTSALCAPVMETLATVSEEVGDEVNVVHVEIWRNFERQEMDLAVQDWNLPSEPWLFVLRADGTVGAKLDGPVSVDELRAAVAEVRGGS